MRDEPEKTWLHVALRFSRIGFRLMPDYWIRRGKDFRTSLNYFSALGRDRRFFHHHAGLCNKECAPSLLSQTVECSNTFTADYLLKGLKDLPEYR